ncbi:MAG: DUF4131 domain-containing protein [Alphaproteobacteria bacterium]|nr:DUF4131 domain-containing protein [Alphaproteobacteria bacterium]
MTIAGLELAPARAARADWLSQQFLLEQERWVLWLPVALAVGIGTYFLLPSEPPPWVGGSSLAATLILFWAWRRSVALPLLIALAACALGFSAAELRAARVAAPVLTRALPFATIQGRVERIVPRDDADWLIIRDPRIDRLDPSATPRRVRLRLSQAAVAGLVPGDVMRIRATLTPPPGPAAPGAFDFRRYLWFAGIGATGFPLSRPEVLEHAPNAVS